MTRNKHIFQARQRRKGKIKNPGTRPITGVGANLEGKTSRSRPTRPVKDRVWVAMLNLRDRLTMKVKRVPTRRDREPTRR